MVPSWLENICKMQAFASKSGKQILDLVFDDNQNGWIKNSGMVVLGTHPDSRPVGNWVQTLARKFRPSHTAQYYLMRLQAEAYETEAAALAASAIKVE